jgi:uncharacterized protein (TIGR02147 family)
MEDMDSSKLMEEISLCTSSAEAITLLMKKKKKLTLRGLALSLEIAPSHLAMILKKQRHPSKDLLFQIAEKFKLNHDETSLLLILSDLDKAKTPALRLRLQKKLSDIQFRFCMKEIEASQFALIAHWYGLAVFEAIKAKQCKPDGELLAEYLNIKISEAEMTLKHLVQMGVLSQDYEVINPNISFESKIPNQVFQQYYLELLEHSRATIKGYKTPRPNPIAVKTMAIDHEDAAEVEAEMDKFMVKLRMIAEKSKNKSQLYCCYMHCFSFR